MLEGGHATFRESRLAEVQLPNILRHQDRRCAPSWRSLTSDWGAALSGSSLAVSAASRSSGGASIAGILEVRAAMMRLFSSLALRSASSCWVRICIVSSFADMSMLGSPSSLGLVSDESPSTQTCTRPSGSFSDCRLPLLTRIRTASTEVSRTSAASWTVSLRLVMSAPPTGLPFVRSLATSGGWRTRPPDVAFSCG
jgi:hypothetical protein